MYNVLCFSSNIAAKYVYNELRFQCIGYKYVLDLYACVKISILKVIDTLGKIFGTLTESWPYASLLYIYHCNATNHLTTFVILYERPILHQYVKV